MTSLVMVLVVLGVGLVPSAQGRPDLSGRWVLVGEVGAGLEAVVPAWQELGVDPMAVTLRRGTHPASTETYVFDDADREVKRVVGQARLCRAAWSDARLVLACRQPGRGPGGQSPPITTQEVLSLGAQGDLVVDRTWRSGTRTTVERWHFTRERP